MGYTFTSGAHQAWITDEEGVKNIGPVFIRAGQGVDRDSGQRGVGGVEAASADSDRGGADFGVGDFPDRVDARVRVHANPAMTGKLFKVVLTKTFNES